MLATLTTGATGTTREAGGLATTTALLTRRDAIRPRCGGDETLRRGGIRFLERVEFANCIGHSRHKTREESRLFSISFSATTATANSTFDHLF